jgi:hypothetical protein
MSLLTRSASTLHQFGFGMQGIVSTHPPATFRCRARWFRAPGWQAQENRGTALVRRTSRESTDRAGRRDARSTFAGFDNRIAVEAGDADAKVSIRVTDTRR